MRGREGCAGQMGIDIPAQPDMRPTTTVRGVVLRDLDRDLVKWRCAEQLTMDEALVVP